MLHIHTFEPMLKSFVKWFMTSGGNSFTGRIPTEYENLRNMQFLDLSEFICLCANRRFIKYDYSKLCTSNVK